MYCSYTYTHRKLIKKEYVIKYARNYDLPMRIKARCSKNMPIGFQQSLIFLSEIARKMYS